MSSAGKSLDQEKSGGGMSLAGECPWRGNVWRGKVWLGNVTNRETFGGEKSGRGLATGKNPSVREKRGSGSVMGTLIEVGEVIKSL